MIEELKKALAADPENPFLQGHVEALEEIEKHADETISSPLLDAAIDLLAGWCDAVKNVGTGWDDWDEWYKDACYRPGPLREMIDARMAKIEAESAK